MLIEAQTRVLDRQVLSTSEFFHKLESHLVQFVERNFPRISNITFFIWGGVAAELFLMDTGNLKKRLSWHDIEICFMKQGLLHTAPSAVGSIEKILLRDPELQLRVGGTRITDPKAGMSFSDFQSTRINLSDGDLFLNNLALTYIRDSGNWEFSVPIPLAISVDNDLRSIEMKSFADLTNLARLARRIRRNISKAIRFEVVSAFQCSDKYCQDTGSLVSTFSAVLHRRSILNVSQESSHFDTMQWLAENQLETETAAERWLFETTCSEVAMRTARLFLKHIASYNDFREFSLCTKSFFSILNHPLIVDLAVKLEIDSNSAFLIFEKYLPTAYRNYLSYTF
jgi:hypothetical protein